MTLRTDAADVGQAFRYDGGEVIKTSVNSDGTRLIRGCASGIAEDRDGERVSARAIRKMAHQPTAGLKITASHDQDWLSEFGDVAKLSHDAATDQLMVECVLPPEGVDPIADKAWREAHRRKLGFSIGGKLQKAYFELVDDGGISKKRKVLDDVLLRHVMLTQKPSYAGTFAEAVAKTWDADAPADDSAWREEREEDLAELPVEKAAAPPKKPDDSDPPEEDPAGPPAGTQDTTPSPDANTSTPDNANDQPDVQDDHDGESGDEDARAAQEEAAQLPMARHLACPHCGHEFAAPLEADAPDSRSEDATSGDDATKTTQETIPVPKSQTGVDLDGALERIRAIAAEATVEKTEPEAEPEVEKTEELAGDDVMKAIAAVDRASTTAVSDLEKSTSEGFELVVKAIKDLREDIAGLPRGRKSVARADGIAPRSEVAKTDDGEVDVEKAVDEAETALDALKVLNRARVGAPIG